MYRLPKGESSRITLEGSQDTRSMRHEWRIPSSALRLGCLPPHRATYTIRRRREKVHGLARKKRWELRPVRSDAMQGFYSVMGLGLRGWSDSPRTCARQVLAAIVVRREDGLTQAQAQRCITSSISIFPYQRSQSAGRVVLGRAYEWYRQGADVLSTAHIIVNGRTRTRSMKEGEWKTTDGVLRRLPYVPGHTSLNSDGPSHR